jgi:GR25 family glycosyltransferase involved in LPS biosynthesis
MPGYWTGREAVISFGDSGESYVALSASCFGFTYYSLWTSRGAVGCTLSHLSVLQDAYDAGYQTIWIMEDDISVRGNPHLLSDWIEELDQLTEWDVLYTDSDYLKNIDPNKDLLTQLPMIWRPDLPFFDLSILLEEVEVGEHFIKVGGRSRTHSLIIRRSGMEKILHFYEEHNMFAPYDWELALVPEIRLYVLKEDIVTSRELCSDTKFKHF